MLETPSFTKHDEASPARIYAREGERFASMDELYAWLRAKGVDCGAADSRKGLRKLFEKISNGEARLMYDEITGCVFRSARVVKMSVEVTIHGECYPLVELCQVFLAETIAPELLLSQDPSRVLEVLPRVKIRSAQVRNTTQVWETLVVGEEPRAGAIRGLIEELGLGSEEAAGVALGDFRETLEVEVPIDWPGIHSVLEIHETTVVLPEAMAKPVFVELNGDQVTIFVATPKAPMIRALLAAILPKIRYVADDLE
jgi:hypothetical protein